MNTDIFIHTCIYLQTVKKKLVNRNWEINNKINVNVKGQQLPKTAWGSWGRKELLSVLLLEYYIVSGNFIKYKLI